MNAAAAPTNTMTAATANAAQPCDEWCRDAVEATGTVGVPVVQLTPLAEVIAVAEVAAPSEVAMAATPAPGEEVVLPAVAAVPDVAVPDGCAAEVVGRNVSVAVPILYDDGDEHAGSVTVTSAPAAPALLKLGPVPISFRSSAVVDAGTALTENGKVTGFAPPPISELSVVVP